MTVIVNKLLGYFATICKVAVFQFKRIQPVSLLVYIRKRPECQFEEE